MRLPQLLKMFLKPVWEGKMHGVTKIGIFKLADRMRSIRTTGASKNRDCSRFSRFSRFS